MRIVGDSQIVLLTLQLPSLDDIVVKTPWPLRFQLRLQSCAATAHGVSAEKSVLTSHGPYEPSIGDVANQARALLM